MIQEVAGEPWEVDMKLVPVSLVGVKTDGDGEDEIETDMAGMVGNSRQVIMVVGDEDNWYPVGGGANTE